MSEQVGLKHVGKIKPLKGETAIVQRENPTSRFVKAQFDNLKLPHNLTHGWTLFSANDFEEVKK
jgi:hypothetical protein